MPITGSDLSVQLRGIAAVLIVLGPFAAMPGWGTSARVGTEGVPAFGHVFVIVGENTELTDLTSATAPYLIGTVKPQSAWLTNYYAVAHHSLANYIAMTSGQYTSCERADGEPAQCHQDVDNLFQQLGAAGRSWRVWMESMPTPCAATDVANGTQSARYDTAHNPAIYYDGIEGTGGAWSDTQPSPECLANDVPTGSSPGGLEILNAALANGSVADFNLIVPDKCDDGHSSCPPVSNRILQFDRFLSQEVPLVLASPAFRTDGVLIVTYDEGTSGHFNFHDRFGRGGRVAFAVLGPGVRPGLYGGTFDHYGFLRTMEDGFRLPDYLGNAVRARTIPSVWS